MKKLWKAFAVCCAIAMLGSAFTACKSDDDDDDDEKPQETPVVPSAPIISVTAPEAAGSVTLSDDAAPDVKLYEGNSVQQALEKLMADNLTGSYTIKVAPGTYKELLFYTGSASIRIEGTGTAEYGTDVLIVESNSGNSNAMKSLGEAHGVTNGYFRGSTRFNGTCNLVLKNVTIQNSYSRSANDGKDTQAEALVFSSTGNLVAYNSTFLSHQDTLYLGQKGGRMWFYKDYIAGDVDFIWGYMDVALFEECTIYCRGDETDKSYIFASRAMAENNANKGIVLLNNKIELPEGVNLWYGRNSGDDTTAAILNSTITGPGTLKSELYQSAPRKFVKDAAGDLAIGYKDYNNTLNGVLVDGSGRLANCGELSERVAKREYNGRYVILNRGYSEADEKYKTVDEAKIWDISAYEEEFGATEDKSSENIYVDPVYVKNMIGGATVQLEPSSDVADLTYTYVSSNPDIATVSETGLVTAIENKTGTSVITVTASNGKIDTMTVAVIPVAIPVTEMALKIEGESIPRYGIATAKISFTPADATYQNCTLTSDNSKVKFYDPAAQTLKESVDVEGIGGSAEIFVWFGDDVSGATITAASTAEDSNTVKATATASTAAGKVTWSSQAGSYRVKTDIQSGKYGIFDGLVIDSLAANSPLISANGKMSLKTADRMQTRNVILYIPVEGASTVKINISEPSEGCSYHVGENLFTSEDKTVFTYLYDGSKTGIVLGSEISGLGTAQAIVGKEIENNGKYLRVDVVRDSADVYVTSIDVEKTGEFTATWDVVEQTGAEGTYNFGSADSVDASNNYASTDGFVTGTGITADGKGHGYAVVADSTIKIKVDGIVQIDVLGCAYGNGAPFKATVGETVLADVASCKASTDGDIGATFYYTTAAEADIVITFSNAGWVHGITVTKLESWNAVTGITLSGETSVSAGATITLSAEVAPSDATDTSVTWSSSDTTIATVADGVVTGISAGSVTITATANDGSGITGTIDIEVTASVAVPEKNKVYTWNFVGLSSAPTVKADNEGNGINVRIDGNPSSNSGYGLYNSAATYTFPVAGNATVIAYISYVNGNGTLSLKNGETIIGADRSITTSDSYLFGAKDHKPANGPVAYTWYYSGEATDLTLEVSSALYIAQIVVDSTVTSGTKQVCCYDFTNDSMKTPLSGDSGSNKIHWYGAEAGAYKDATYGIQAMGSLYLSFYVDAACTVKVNTSYEQATGKLFLAKNGASDQEKDLAGSNSANEYTFNITDSGVYTVAMPKNTYIKSISIE